MAFKTTLLKHSRGQYMTTVPQNEIITAIKDLTPKAYQMLMYYYSKADGWNFSDTEMADTLDTTERMIKAYRKELVDKEYLWIIPGTLTVYFVGRKAVYDFKYKDKKNPDE